MAAGDLRWFDGDPAGVQARRPWALLTAAASHGLDTGLRRAALDRASPGHAGAAADPATIGRLEQAADHGDAGAT